jgi:RimJ/RimL family protein N-acetyltransferase/GNAT superfamily N-acetyltransferase
MQIEPVDPVDDDVLRACHAVQAAAVAADDPHGEPPMSVAMLRVRLSAGYAGEPSEAWYAPMDGSPDPVGQAGQPGQCGPVAGWYRIQFPDLENRDRAFLTLVVHPGFRRRGLGLELITHARQRAAAEARKFIDSWALEGSAGASFARRVGAEPGFVDARRIVDLRTVPGGRFAELKAEAAEHATGYSLTSWAGPTPEDRLGQVAHVLNAMNDAPREEGWFEDDIWDADRVRTRGDMRIRLAGFRGYAVGAIHDETGEMAALTQVSVDPAVPSWGHQGMTAVTRPHRGHRLGLLTKAAMLEWLAAAEPQLERIETTNVEVNSYMIAINEALGYRLAEPGMQFFALPVS